MEGLVKSLNLFAEKNDTQVVFGVKDLFTPVCTLEGLQMDLKICPEGNFQPSPYYLGPIVVEPGHDCITAVTDAIIKTTTDEFRLLSGDVWSCQNETFQLVSGWVKSFTVATEPVHEHWKRCLTEQKKPGGFTGLKNTHVATVCEPEWFLLPTLEQVGQYLGRLVNSSQIIMDYEEKKTQYDHLVEEAAQIHKEVWKKYMGKQEKSKKALDKYNNSGKKPTDLKGFSTALAGFEKAIDDAKKFQKDCETARDKLCEYVKAFTECIARPDFPVNNGSFQRSINSIKKALECHQVDMETGIAVKLVTDKQLKTHKASISGFIARVDSAINKPKWPAKEMTPSDVLGQIKKIQPKLTSWNVRVKDGSDKDTLERLHQLITEASADAQMDKSHNVGEMVYLANQLQTKYPMETPVTKKAQTKTAVPDDVDEMHEEAGDLYGEFSSLDRTFKAERRTLAQEDVDEWLDRKYKQRVMDLHAVFEKKPSQATYKPFKELAEKAITFFHQAFESAGIELSDEIEDDDDVVDDDAEIEFESEEESSDESSIEKISTNKRPREEDDEEVPMELVIKAFHTGTNNDRDHLNTLFRAGNSKVFKQALEATVLRNKIHYHVIMLDENGHELQGPMLRIIEAEGKNMCPTREQAVARGKELQSLISDTVTYTFRIDEIRPNGV